MGVRVTGYVEYARVEYILPILHLGVLEHPLSVRVFRCQVLGDESECADEPVFFEAVYHVFNGRFSTVVVHDHDRSIGVAESRRNGCI